MNITIDFHSHVLPEVDDGSGSLEESLALLRLEAEQGVAQVVATPHFYPGYDSPERFLRRRNEAEARLREAMADQNDLPEVIMGAEVYYFPGISESNSLSELTFYEKRCILIEMPESPWTESMYRELANIWEKWGITPIIAHVDRYIRPFRTYGIPERLAELPVVVQANGSFFRNGYTRNLAMRLLRENKIQLLGSDCHNMDTRKPNLGETSAWIRKRLGQSAIDRINNCGRELLLRDSIV